MYSHFVSETDRFLQEFDELNTELSLSQLKEIAKYQRIYALRDKPCKNPPTTKLWEEF
jgi:hypothetical protein